MTPASAMEMVLECFVRWAMTESDMRAATIVGSRARTDRPADAWSDLDLVIIVRDPRRYLTTTDWLAQIGVPLLTFLEPTAVGALTERRVLFEEACDVDFSFIPLSMVQDWHQRGMPDELILVAQRGVRLLFDKDGTFAELLRGLPPQATPRIAPPSESMFTEAVHDFLYHVIWCAKKLYRGEQWIAKQSCDGYLKRKLLQMIAWDAQARRQWQLDTWHEGRFLEQWARPEVLTRLPDTFAVYASQDIQRALFATLSLYHELAIRVASTMNYAYPDAAHAYVMTWLQQHSVTGDTPAAPAPV
jgi:aminoglycoside 6-adenylyltransferase